MRFCNVFHNHNLHVVFSSFLILVFIVIAHIILYVISDQSVVRSASLELFSN